MTASEEEFDLAFRPDTYWPESRTVEQLLANIKGKARRDMARRILSEEGFTGLSEFVAREELDDEQAAAWGAVHPLLMGGEYLPGLRDNEVEIARISLASTTGDQTSIRARNEDGKIHYSVVDEYETQFELPVRTSDRPLTTGDLVRLVDETEHPGDVSSGGLVLSHWNYIFAEEGDPAGAVSFVTVESAYYPDLASYYRALAEQWMKDCAVGEGVQD